MSSRAQACRSRLLTAASEANAVRGVGLLAREGKKMKPSTKAKTSFIFHRVLLFAMLAIGLGLYLAAPNKGAFILHSLYGFVMCAILYLALNTH